MSGVHGGSVRNARPPSPWSAQRFPGPRQHLHYTQSVRQLVARDVLKGRPWQTEGFRVTYSES